MVNYQVAVGRVEALVLRSEAVKQGGRSSRRSDGTSASAKGLSKVLILTSSLVWSEGLLRIVRRDEGITPLCHLWW